MPWTGTFFFQLLALAGGPAAVLLSQEAKYVAVPLVCAANTVLALHVISALGFAAAVASGLLAAHEWRRAGGGWPDDEGGERGRTRLLGMLGLLLGMLSALVIVAQWIPDFIVSPCQH